MARLIEPDGTPGLEVTVAYAIDFCRTHPGWTWQYLGGDRLVPVADW